MCVAGWEWKHLQFGCHLSSGDQSLLVLESYDCAGFAWLLLVPTKFVRIEARLGVGARLLVLSHVVRRDTNVHHVLPQIGRVSHTYFVDDAPTSDHKQSVAVHKYYRTDGPIVNRSMSY